MKTPASRLKIWAFLGAAWLGVGQPLARSQTAASTLAGHVIDGINKTALSGAHVVIEGTNREEVTDAEGAFVFPRLAPGHYVVKVDYLGFSPMAVNVDAGEGRTDRDIVLGAEVVRLEAFKVEGSLEGSAKAINQQKTADNIQNIVAADAIGNFPDSYVADALQRLPGITMDRTRNTGRYIVIRGVQSAYNNVMIDGQQASGSNRQDASFELDSLSVGLIDRVEISKTVTPDMDATAIGGTVNIKTPTAFSRGGRAFWGSARYGYNDLGGGKTYEGMMSYSDIFGAKRNFGLMLSASASDVHQQTDDQEEGWAQVSGSAAIPPPYFLNKVELRSYKTDRKRNGFAANLDYKPDANTSLYVRSQYSMFHENELFPILQLNLTNRVSSDDNGGVTTGGDARRQLKNAKNDKRQFSVIGGGETRLNDTVISYSAARAEAVENMKQNDTWDFRETGVNFSYKLNNWFPLATVTNGVDITNPAGYLFNSYQQQPEIIKSNQTSLQADLRQRRELGGFAVNLKAGGKFVRSDRVVDSSTTTFNKVGNGFALSNVAMSAGRPDFLDGRYDFGATIDPGLGGAYLAANPAASTSTFTDISTDDYRMHQDVGAGYGMGSVTLGRATLIGGLRVEHTETVYDASQVLTINKVNSTVPAHSTHDYTHVLPGLLLRYMQTDRLVFRAAWTNTIARPNFADAAPVSTVDSSKLTINTGNPNLKAAHSTNFDFSAEYYTKPLGVISAGLFYKNIEHLAYSTVSVVTNPAGAPAGTYQLTEANNADATHLLGVELNWQQQLTFLPAPFDGFGFGANYTHTKAEVNVPTRPGVKLLLFKQSPDLGNLFISYQKGPLDARLAWVGRSKQFLKLGADANLDFYSGSSLRLDFTASYKLNAHLSVFGDVLNITNDQFTRYQGTQLRPIQAEVYGFTTSVGIRWNL